MPGGNFEGQGGELREIHHKGAEDIHNAWMPSTEIFLRTPSTPGRTHVHAAIGKIPLRDKGFVRFVSKDEAGLHQLLTLGFIVGGC